MWSANVVQNSGRNKKEFVFDEKKVIINMIHSLIKHFVFHSYFTGISTYFT